MCNRDFTDDGCRRLGHQGEAARIARKAEDTLQVTYMTGFDAAMDMAVTTIWSWTGRFDSRLELMAALQKLKYKRPDPGAEELDSWTRPWRWYLKANRAEAAYVRVRWTEVHRRFTEVE